MASLLRHVFTNGDGFGKSQLSIILKDLLERVWLNFRDFAQHVTSTSVADADADVAGGKTTATAIERDSASGSELPAVPPAAWAAARAGGAAATSEHGVSSADASEREFLQSLPAFRRNDAVYNDLVQALQSQLLSIWSENHAAAGGAASGGRVHDGVGQRPSLLLRSVRTC